MDKQIVVMVAALTAIALADWTSIGPYSGPICAAAISPNNPQVVYASPHSYPTPFIKSTDGGANWAMTAQLGNYAFDIAVHPTDPNIVYAGCGTLYKTTDGGTSWSYVSMPSGSYVYAVLIDPQNPQTVYTTGYAYNGSFSILGVHKTTDGGATWDTTWLDTLRYSIGYALAMDPTDPRVVYCGGYTGQSTTVFKTTDAGATWQRISAGYDGYYINALHVSPLDPDIVLAGTYLAGILRSTDAGATWTQAATHSNTNALAAVPNQPSRIYAATDSLLYLSEDTGRTWVQTRGHPPMYNYGTLLTTPLSDEAVLCGTKAGLYLSTDRGNTWQSLTDRFAFARVPVIAIAASDPRMMYIEHKDNAVYKTTDGGFNWRRCPEFLSCGSICGFAFDPASPDVVWALEGSG